MKLVFFILQLCDFSSPSPKFPHQPSKITSPHNTLLSSKSVFVILLCSFFSKIFNLLFILDGGYMSFSIYRFGRPCFGSKLFFVLGTPWKVSKYGVISCLYAVFFLKLLTSPSFWTGDACHLVFTDFARPCFGSKLFFILALREKCPNTEFFLVGTFLDLDWIQRFAP